ncbi:MAG: hypothetical protein ABL957_10685 [Parvularculaceae bacterium]
MQSSDIYIIDDPWTTFLVGEEELASAPALVGVPGVSLYQLARLGESVVEALVNLPQDTHGHRYLARMTYREEFPIERDCARVDLGRSPATATSVELNGTTLDPAEYRLHAASGALTRIGGLWPARANLTVAYEGGWRTPEQIRQGAPADAPMMPASFTAAVIRAAALAWSDWRRSDPAVRMRREEDADAGAVEQAFAAPPLENGTDAELFRLLAPWRRLVLA